MDMDPDEMTTVVLDVRAMLRGSENVVVERVLGRLAGVHRVEANAVAQTATVCYDPARTSLKQLRRAVEECGYHCAGQSVPSHVCDPAVEPGRPAAATSSSQAAEEGMDHGDHNGHRDPYGHGSFPKPFIAEDKA